MADKQLELYHSFGGTIGVGWLRDDMKVIHMFANERPGEIFQPSDGNGGPHWPCGVCDEHGYTEKDFRDQILPALEKGPHKLED